ncbi:MAG: peptidoglycan recognition protein family protein [Nocardioidaceae bacterium]
MQHDESDTPWLSRRRLLGGAVALGGVLTAGAAGISAATPAYAGTLAPEVYDRADWDARPPSHPIDVLHHGPDHIVVHHTATENATDYSLEHALQLSRDIQDMHMDGNGWWDIGEQLTISRGGYIMEGRDHSLDAISEQWHVVGAQTANENSHTVGIENEGLYTKVAPPAALLDSLIDTCAWLCQVYTLDPYDAIVGHRDYNATECPGDVLYKQLPNLRDRVAARLGGGAARRRSADTAHRPHREGPTPASGEPYDHGPALG